MVSEKLAKSAELGLSGVLLAELECLHRSALVHDLQPRIVSEDIEDSSVCLPQELEPRSYDSAVCPVPGLFSRHSREQD